VNLLTCNKNYLVYKEKLYDSSSLKPISLREEERTASLFPRLKCSILAIGGINKKEVTQRVYDT